MHPFRLSRSLVSLLEGDGLPLEFTAAGGAPPWRLLANNVAEIRSGNPGRTVVMTRSARDDDQLPQIWQGIDACSRLDRQAQTIIAAPGLSGGAPTEDRPDLLRLFEMLERKEADTVWWLDLNRVSRSREFAVETLNHLRRFDVDLILDNRFLLPECENMLSAVFWKTRGTDATDRLMTARRLSPGRLHPPPDGVTVGRMTDDANEMGAEAAADVEDDGEYEDEDPLPNITCPECGGEKWVEWSPATYVQLEVYVQLEDPDEESLLMEETEDAQMTGDADTGEFYICVACSTRYDYEELVAVGKKQLA